MIESLIGAMVQVMVRVVVTLNALVRVTSMSM